MRYRSATRSPGANRPGPAVEIRAAPLEEEEGVFRVPVGAGAGDDGAMAVGFWEESSIDFIASRVRYRRSAAACQQLTVISASARPSSASDLQSMERTMLQDALQSARFNKSKAAKALGLTRQQLYVRLRKYGLE
jgi:DNA-binding NtrC family response regulator